MARGPLMLMPMPTTAMVDMAAMVDMVATAMGATDTAMATVTARGPLRPSPTTAMADTPAAMAATAMVDTDTESKKSKSISRNNTKNPTPNHLKLTYLNGQENYGCVSF